MKLALLGVTGPSGRALISEALARGHQLTIYARTPSKLDGSLQTKPNVTIIKGTLEDEDTLHRVFHGQDVVLSFLGAVTPSHPSARLLTDAFERIFRIMKEEKVYRFVGTGTPSYRDPKDKFTLLLWVLVSLLSLILPKVYQDVVGYSIVVSNEKEIDWSWFRVMRANDKTKTGKIIFGYWSDGRMTFGSVTRGDLADAMIDEITERKWVKQMPLIRSV